MTYVGSRYALPVALYNPQLTSHQLAEALILIAEAMQKVVDELVDEHAPLPATISSATLYVYASIEAALEEFERTYSVTLTKVS